MLTFEPTTHRYTYAGQRVPGVSEIIRDAGLMPDLSFLDPWYLERGTRVHEATELYDAGDLDEASIDPAIAGYVDGWRRFRADAGDRLQITGVEVQGHHAGYGYAGRADRLGTWDAADAVVDAKCGKPDRWHGLQLAAYAHLWVPSATVRLGVYLAKDGTYKLERYADRADWPVFQAACSLWHWRAAHNLLPKE